MSILKFQSSGSYFVKNYQKDKKLHFSNQIHRQVPLQKTKLLFESLLIVFDPIEVEIFLLLIIQSQKKIITKKQNFQPVRGRVYIHISCPC